MTTLPHPLLSFNLFGASPSRPAAEPFQSLAGPHYRGLAVADLAASELREIVASPEAKLEGASVRVIKRGRSALVVKARILVSKGEVEAAYKRMGCRRPVRRMIRALRQDRATRSFQIGHELLQLGIATPRPLLAVSPRWPAFLSPPFIATEWLDAVPIDEFLRNAAELPAGRRRLILRQAAKTIGELIGKLHANDYSHRDLKAGNVLVREQDGKVAAFLIDLDGVSRRRFLTPEVRLTNLARLVIATNDIPVMTSALWRRALAAYLSACGENDGWKNVWRRLGEVFRIRLARRRRAACR